jgi:hypothetical protein
LSATTDARVRIDWHLSDRDLQNDAGKRLLPLARAALDGAALTFVFDRRQQQVALAEGLTRQHTAVLMTVGLNLPLLLQMTGAPADTELFLQKLGSLARVAMSAGAQKRAALRRLCAKDSVLLRSFFLDRARVLIVPIGLEETVHGMGGQGLCAPDGLRLGKQIVKRLNEALRSDGRTRLLDSCIGAPGSFAFDPASGPTELRDVAGLTAWDDAATVKNQLKAAAALHAVAGGGTAAVRIARATPEQLVEWLGWAWQRTAIAQMRFLSP